MFKLKIVELFLTKIFVPVCCFVANLMQGGYWWVLGIIALFLTILSKSGFKTKPHYK